PPNRAAVIAVPHAPTAHLLAGSRPAAKKPGAHAGNLVRQVAKLAGGSGGGRPDSAMAGAKDVGKVSAAVSQVEQIVSDMLSQSK
ncbi:MAG: DHHA1 domain-containing protein, partial [Clostridiales bacterium]|nr:DHHA1 domain-containing protein [Clostridiales bacterium]